MNSVVGRSVKQVRLHTVTHATGVGNLGPNITKDSSGVKGQLRMEVVSEGVLVTVGQIQVVIPPGNIISYELEPAKSASLNEANSPNTR